MSLKFIINRDGMVYLKSGTISILVSSDLYNICGENKAKYRAIIIEKIERLIGGEKNIFVSYKTRHCGEMIFGITEEQDFHLTGGEISLKFGGSIKISCSYQENKEDIDNFLNYMLQIAKND